MKKNTATKWIVFAFDRTTNAAKTGDAANITANVRIDGAAANAVDDVNPTELETGYYVFDITAAECNGDLIVICPVSATANIQVIGVPGAAWTNTVAAAAPTLAEIEASAVLAKEATVTALSFASQASVDVISGNTAAILIDTGATLDAKIDAIAAAVVVVDGIVDTVAAGVIVIDGIVDDILVDTSAFGAPPTVEAIADAVWDEASVGHEVAGSTGLKLASAATAGDPWSTPLPGAYAPGTAGKIISDVKVEVDAVLVDTGTTLDDKLTPLTLAGIADALWDEPIADHDAAGTTGKKLTDAAAASTPPTVGQIADAVWDEATAGHTSVGSTGEAILATISAIYPSAVSIAAALWAKIITGAVTAETALASLYNGWTADAGAGSGAGAIASTITVNVGAVPEDGVEVWVTTDIEGANVIAGTLVTDTFGHVVFMLDAGTYFLWKQKAGKNFTNPETIVVT